MADSSLSTTQPNTADSREEDLDASIEGDISQDPINQDSMQVDSTENNTMQSSNNANENPPPAEPRIPAKKDASLREFLNNMDDYAPIVVICADRIDATFADIDLRYQTPSRTTTSHSPACHHHRTRRFNSPAFSH